MSGLVKAAAFEARQVCPVRSGNEAQDPEIERLSRRVTGALMLCILFALAGALALRMRQSGQIPMPWPHRREKRRLALQESLRVSPQIQLCIVACDGSELLLAASPTSAMVLRVLEPHAGEDHL